MTKTNTAWKEIFRDKNIERVIDKKGYYKIDSKEIGKYREARLMAKFDHRSSLPAVFQERGLSILPTKRGEYIISEFDAYETIKELNNESLTYVNMPPNIKSINPLDIYSESISLNFAHLSGILSDFFETTEVYHTLSGRMGSSEFSFSINNKNHRGRFEIKVENAQVEIDGGYETERKLYLVEAKNSVPADFLIRQLYYPYRLWHNKFMLNDVEKEISTVFLTYSNDIWNLYEYQFLDYRDYNSLKLIKHKKYMIRPEKITLDEIKSLVYKTEIVNEPSGTPYPQANSFERVINLLEILMNGDLSKESIHSDFNTNALDKRQVDYYLNACIYLGLLEINAKDNEKIYGLNEKARNIMSKDFKEKNLMLAKEILKYPSFNKAGRLYIEKTITQPKIVEIMEDSQIYGVSSQSTYERRASTVNAWINWIFALVEY